MNEPRWLQLLAAAVEADPRGRAGVADRIGYSRGAVSTALAGKYAADPGGVAQAVMDHFDRLICPHLANQISPKQCADYATRPCPTTSPREVRHWRACQSCPNNVNANLKTKE
jgi:hypothetical protein